MTILFSKGVHKNEHLRVYSLYMALIFNCTFSIGLMSHYDLITCASAGTQLGLNDPP